ncbi:MAG: hypothetical protein JO025_17670 [Verrucomicrobia bacterium]|nr:hypothetical protein [Verrucomicrobiota bacterium]
MNIFLGLVPFIVFWVLMRLVSPVAGLSGAALASLLLCFRVWRLGKAIKILELGSLILFTLLSVYTVAFHPPWTVPTVRLVVDAGLFAIILFSLLVGKPFTLQYARESVPQEHWTSPQFFRTSAIISSVWGAAFAVSAIADAFLAFVPAVPGWIDVALSIVALLGAAQFTKWYRSSRSRVGVAPP